MSHFASKTRNRLSKAAKSFSTVKTTEIPDRQEASSRSKLSAGVNIPEEIKISSETVLHDEEELENVLEDSPAIRESLRQKEQVLENIKSNLKKMIKLAKQFQSTGEAFRNISTTFGEEITRFDFSQLPGDLSQSYTTIAKNFGDTITLVGDYYSTFLLQVNEEFTQPLETFVREDIAANKELCKQHLRIRGKYDQSVSKYSHVKKGETEKIQEARNELLSIRKEFHTSSLDYASNLSRIGTLSNIKFMDCVSSFITSQKIFFNQGFEIRHEVENDLENVFGQLATGYKYIEVHDSILQERKNDLKLNGYVKDDGETSKGQKETTGHLFRKLGNRWKRGYYSIVENELYKIGKQNDRTFLVNLMLTTIRPARDVERRFCFEIVSPSETIILQAESENSFNHWMSVVQNAIASALNQNAPNALKQQPVTPRGAEKSGFRSQLSLVDPGNNYCADCRTMDPEWASINLGILICITCSGVHRQIGTHITKVRSTTLDTWDKELRLLMLALGNTKVNKIYEYNLPEDAKLHEDSTREERDQFIRDKYEKKAFIKPSEVASKEKRLFTYAKKNNIPSALHLLALGANVNWKNRKNEELTALHMATISNNLALCDLLIQNGADINTLDANKWTPLHHAAKLDCVSVLILLIRRGAKLTVQDSEDKTPLAVAIDNVRADCVTLLRLAMHAEKEHPGNAMEDESFAVALKEFSDSIQNHDKE